MEVVEPPGLRRFERDAGGDDTVGPEDRELAINDAEARILLQQPVDVGVAGFAIGAGIVVEFDQRDFGLRRAAPRASERRFDRGAVGVEHRRILRVAQGIGSLDEDVRVGEHPLPDDPAAEILRYREQQKRRHQQRSDQAPRNRRRP